MFSICTTFDENYFKYGYPMCCSVQNKYPTSICVVAINLSKPNLRLLQKMPNTTVIKKKLDPQDPVFTMRCYNAKVEAVKSGFANYQTNIAIIDADCLILDSLAPFDEVFERDYDLGVYTRWTPEASREWTNFCNHNIFLRNSEAVRKMVDDWEACLPYWWDRIRASHTTLNPAYSEQACLWNAYWSNRDSIRLLNTKNIDPPILHAKGAKYPKHSDYKNMRYDKKCKAAIEAYEHK